MKNATAGKATKSPTAVAAKAAESVDITAPAHVLVFRPLIERLFREGVDSAGAPMHLALAIPEKSSVGAQVVGELRDKAIIAILLSLFAIVLYIRMRFAEYSYGFAAVAALVHDVLITLGVLAVPFTWSFSALVAVLIAVDAIHWLHLFFASLLQGVTFAFQMPARQAILPKLVSLSVDQWTKLLDGEDVAVPGVESGFAPLGLQGHVAGRGLVRGETMRHEIPKVQARWLAKILALVSSRAMSEEREG